jgi:hypothetical protein
MKLKINQSVVTTCKVEIDSLLATTQGFLLLIALKALLYVSK